jgi:hypothetical protein
MMNPPICMYEHCIECPLLAICEKEENEYDVESVKNHLEDIHCPDCGFPIMESTEGKRVCPMCLVRDEWRRHNKK